MFILKSHSFNLSADFIIFIIYSFLFIIIELVFMTNSFFLDLFTLIFTAEQNYYTSIRISGSLLSDERVFCCLAACFYEICCLWTTNFIEVLVLFLLISRTFTMLLCMFLEIRLYLVLVQKTYLISPVLRWYC